jgi:hypothetical protein
MFFQDGLGTGTHIASPVPQAQLPEVGLYPWSSQGLQAGETVIGYIIKLDEPRSEGLAQPFHHASDAGNVVIGGTDEGEKAFGGVLSQKSHTLKFLSHLLEMGVHGTPVAIQLSQADIQPEVLVYGL